MSEFWVSKKKYFCKYCDIYIADDAPSRQQHENGLRHKGNKDRFIRSLYKDSEKRKKDKQDEERDMKAIEQAAHAAYAKDVGYAAAGAAVASSSTSAPRPAPAPKAAPSGDKWANYSTAEQLGIVDLDAERAAAEAAIRLKEGRVGQWSTVALVPGGSTSDSTATTSAHPPTQPQKRARDPSPEYVDPDDTRRFKVRQKVSVGLSGNLYDPGEIRIKRKEDGSNAAPAPALKTENANATQGSLVPEWKPTQWRRPGEDPDQVKTEEGVDEVPPSADQGLFKAEPAEALLRDGDTSPNSAEDLPSIAPVKREEAPDEKPVLDPPAEPSGGLFKKRKIKSSAAGGRRPM